MASLGSVVSTAVSGGDAPVFKRSAEVKEVLEQGAAMASNQEALENKVDKLSEMLAELLAEKAAANKVVEDIAPAPTKSTAKAGTKVEK